MRAAVFLLVLWNCALTFALINNSKDIEALDDTFGRLMCSVWQTYAKHDELRDIEMLGLSSGRSK